MINVSFCKFPQKYLCGMGNCFEIQNRQLKDFSSLSLESRERLLMTSETISIAKGQSIFKEMQYLNKLYCIKYGACKFSKVDNAGQEHILRFLGKGEAMGKRSIITNNGAMVSATALTEMELCCLDKNEIQDNLKKNPRFCQDFLDSLIEDVNINEFLRINFTNKKSIKSRLASLLLYLLDKYGADEKGKLNLKLKREDMATVLGTSPEYIINLLKQFKNFGIIDTERSAIFILSKDRLKEMTM